MTERILMDHAVRARTRLAGSDPMFATRRCAPQALSAAAESRSLWKI
jgi:hypothetical protein